ncbi:hypothetical protein TWF696_004394 [Orbilia brochopaga]|uniref:Cytochrome P450 n=1 Tax=Orbilia brochopaga TaxID=3140254 RepID=A0AAV9V601_9PEZI
MLSISLTPVAAAVCGFLLLASILYVVLFIGRRERGLPPGPPTIPILGNVHQLPTTGAHFKFTEWARKYGGLYSLKLGTGTALVVTDREIVKKLMDKRSSVTSDRPPSYVSYDLITKGDHLLVMHYNDTWRKIRKYMHRFFMESMCEKKHIVLQNAEATQMMVEFLQQPENHMLHTKRFSNSIITTLLFGIRTPTYDSRHAKELYDIMERWSAVMEPGNTPPVDIYPIFKYIPERFFGNWITRASEVGRDMEKLYANMITQYKSKVATGNKTHESFFDILLREQEKKSEFTAHELAFIGGVQLEGGSDTSASILTAFVQAMVHWPEVQKKAQKQIDAVVGEDRSPNWDDFPNLQYVNAIMKETHRWRPVTPLSFPHCLSEEQYLDGYLLPKGSTIILNVWGIQNDESVYPNPEEFDPSRFENHKLLAPDYAASSDWKSRDHYSFGVGRRICPGIHLAERNVFLGIAKLLWAFNFEEAVGDDGSNIKMNVDPRTGYTEGFLHCAHPFKCKITVRSEARRATILREFEDAKRVFLEYTE